MNKTFLNGLLDQIVDRGRNLLDRSISGLGQGETIEELSRALLSGRGESSGVVIAQRILAAYRSFDAAEKRAYFVFLADEFAAGEDAVRDAASGYLEQPGPATLRTLTRAVEAPRQEFFRRLNLAPGGTADIVAMRADLLDEIRQHPELSVVDEDLVHLIGAWFNRGFLVPRRIDWTTPATILEKIIEYEAVHEIHGWNDLKRRLDPADRRCYGFFHPSLVDEPLIFVEVALAREVPGSIQQLLNETRGQTVKRPTTAVFYSISNCQRGLGGISFGNFLIKQVVTDLVGELPSLKTFVTLSPIPMFTRWLAAERSSETSTVVGSDDVAALAVLDRRDWHLDPDASEAIRGLMTRLGAYYLVSEKAPGGRPLDPVARFHLGNGASLERINWLGDVSEQGIGQSSGLMVNYLYDPKDIERNHEAFANEGKVAVAGQVLKLARSAGKRAKLSETA